MVSPELVDTAMTILGGMLWKAVAEVMMVSLANQTGGTQVKTNVMVGPLVPQGRMAVQASVCSRSMCWPCSSSMMIYILLQNLF